MKINTKIPERKKFANSHCRIKTDEPKAPARAVHVGRAILNGTLGESRSKLLLHGIYDADDAGDFGESVDNQPDTKDKDKDKDK